MINATEQFLPGSIWRYYPGIDAYAWTPRQEVRSVSVDEMHHLLADGFSKISIEQSSQIIALEGQLCEVMTVERGGKMRHLARKSDKAFVSRIPVALMFRAHDFLDPALIQSPTDPIAIDIYQDLPPPSIGECALVWTGTGNGWRLHEIIQLNREAKLIQDRIAELVSFMASPATAWIMAHALGSEMPLMPAMSEIDDQALAVHLAALTKMRLRSAADPELWMQQWSRLRDLARQLATIYWTLLKREGSREAIVDTTSSAILLPGDAITQTIMRSLVSSDEYHPNPEQTMATWMHPLSNAPVTITIERNDSETWQQMMSILDSLGDEAVDTFCALLAIALTTNGNMGLSQSFYLAPDDILEFCGRKQSNRVYTAEQRAAVIQVLVTLSRIQVSATVPAKRRGRIYRMESPIVDLLRSTVGEYTSQTGDALWQRREIKLGNWSAIAPQLNQQTVYLLRKILSYHPQKDRFAKRLGRYFTLAFAGDPAPIDITIGDMLRHAGIPFDPQHHQDRTRKTLESALQALVSDRIIAAAKPLIEATTAGWARQQRIAQCTRGWWQEYEQQLWRIDPCALPQNMLPSMQMALLDGQ